MNAILASRANRCLLLADWALECGRDDQQAILIDLAQLYGEARLEGTQPPKSLPGQREHALRNTQVSTRHFGQGILDNYDPTSLTCIAPSVVRRSQRTF